MEYSNAKKLAAVVSYWAHPAISQIATGKIGTLAFVRQLEQTLVASGLVGQDYKVVSEISPFVTSAVDALIEPILEAYFGKVPDASLPKLVHNLVETAMLQASFSVLDGLVTFSREDMAELKVLLDKNLPVCDGESYTIIK